MPSPLSADRPAAQPPGRGPVDALISQTRRLKGEVDAVRRDAQGDGSDPRERWQRALCDLALHQLDDLDAHLAQLRDGPLPAPGAAPAPRHGSLLSRVGTAEWNLLTDEAGWSGEFCQILGRDPAAPPLTLDELPSLVLDEDRPTLTAMVTHCLVDARPIDGEFRIVRPDGEVRTVHMMGEPVLDADGSAASMWAVLRDVSELRRTQRAVSETRDSLTARPCAARAAVEPQEAAPLPWHGPLRLPRSGPPALDVAARHLLPAAGAPLGGDWYDVLELPGGETLLTVGDLTGHGAGAAADRAMVLGAVRGMAMAGTGPGQLMGWLNQLVDAAAEPALGSAVCCRYRPGTRTLVWAQAGHPAPLLFRDGTGRVLDAPDGVLLGATTGAAYGQAEEALRADDLLLLHTDGLVSGHSGTDAAGTLLALAPLLAGARTAQDCVRTVVEEFGGDGRQDHACVLAVKVTS
ncbi:PP2C family protein-serine/threonine phosphatase [Streptomyces sp. NPDC085946]|uniref:PP2C family protein-serine/threonine phosphatase n=1 Tax=Streptomyces sp. NPDC085946 TaxID=3365744 RepID=UPI0037D56C98